MARFLDVGFFQSLLSNLVAVGVGATVGLPMGLWLDRRSRQRSQADERARERAHELEDEVRVLEAVRSAIQHNRELLRQVRENLSPGSGYDTIYFNLDPRAIDLLMPALSDRTSDFHLLNRINNLRYQLGHVARKIDTHYNLEYGGAAAIGGARLQRRDEMIRSLLPHVGDVLKEADGILAEIDEATRRLQKS